jgi:hypothetical protein
MTESNGIHFIIETDAVEQIDTIYPSNSCEVLAEQI